MHQWLWRDFAGINELPERCQHTANPFSPGLFTDQRKIALLCSACPSALLFSWFGVVAFPRAGGAISSTWRIRHLLLFHPSLVDIWQLGCPSVPAEISGSQGHVDESTFQSRAGRAGCHRCFLDGLGRRLAGEVQFVGSPVMDLLILWRCLCSPGVWVWKDRCLLRKAGASPEMENANPLPLNCYHFEMKGLSGKDMGAGITVLY